MNRFVKLVIDREKNEIFAVSLKNGLYEWMCDRIVVLYHRQNMVFLTERAYHIICTSWHFHWHEIINKAKHVKHFFGMSKFILHMVHYWYFPHLMQLRRLCQHLFIIRFTNSCNKKYYFQKKKIKSIFLSITHLCMNHD